MTPNADPWRTLGLAPGSTQDEIRRAYRRLAKANHPDAAGDAALPRFLAIQAAYEMLASPLSRRRAGSRPSTGSASASSREPWRADADRARASARPDGRRPGSRPGARPGGASAARPGAGSDPAAAPGDAGKRTDPPGTAGTRSGRRQSSPGADGTGDAAPGPGRSRRASGRRRSGTTATPYSTSYDPVDEDAFEPDWSGATWYGASSGTYWTINPKEYADPRKHGPEYQARARRSGRGWTLDAADGADGLGDPAAAPVRPGSADPAAAAARPSSKDPDAETIDPAIDRAGDGGGSSSARANAPAGSRPRKRAWSGSPWGFSPSDPTEAGPGSNPGPHGVASASPSDRPRSAPPRSPTWRSTSDPGPHLDRPRLHGPLLPEPRTAAGRLATALLGWPPLGAAVAVLIGESTGCGRYAASCPEVSSPGTWIVEVAIVFLLLAVPPVAAWSAHGTLAVIAVGVPSAIVLSAGGGAREPDASNAVLLAILVLAYVLGVVYAVVVPRLPRRA